MKFLVSASLAVLLLAACQTTPPPKRPSVPPPLLTRSQVSMFDWRPLMVTDQYSRQQVTNQSCVTIYYFNPPGNPRPKTQRLCIGETFVGFRLEQIVPPKGSIPPWLVFRDLQTGGERLLRQMVSTPQ